MFVVLSKLFSKRGRFGIFRGYTTSNNAANYYTNHTTNRNTHRYSVSVALHGVSVAVADASTHGISNNITIGTTIHPETEFTAE